MTDLPTTPEGRRWLKQALVQEIDWEQDKMDRSRQRIQAKQELINELERVDKGKINGL